MNPFKNVLGIALFLAALPGVSGGVGETAGQAPSRSGGDLVIAPGLRITNELGRSVPLLSPEAYRAEFRYLRRVGRKFDLSGPARRMTGLQMDVLETQWPLMQCCYFGFACVNLAEADPGFRAEALAEARWLIEALQTPRLTGFVTEHFGPPFGEGFRTPSVYAHGLFLSLAVRYRETSGDPGYDPLIDRIAFALSREFAGSEQGILPSYPGMWWITDNLTALSALARYDRLHRTSLSVVKDRFLREVRTHYLDKSGLMASYIDPEARSILQGARGVSTCYALHFLGDVDPEWAASQYARARREFFRNTLGFAAVREFPEGAREETDVDSGAVLFGLGTAASGFGIAAAAVMADERATTQLLKSSVLVGSPVLRGDELRYEVMPNVGQAVVLFGKTEWLKSQAAKAGQDATGRPWTQAKSPRTN